MKTKKDMGHTFKHLVKLLGPNFQVLCELLKVISDLVKCLKFQVFCYLAVYIVCPYCIYLRIRYLHVDGIQINLMTSSYQD